MDKNVDFVVDDDVDNAREDCLAFAMQAIHAIMTACADANEDERCLADGIVTILEQCGFSLED